MKIIFTGFGPWATHEVNPSWEILGDFQPDMPKGWRFEKLKLPVDWAESWPKLERHIDEDTAAVVMLGLAARRSGLSFERYAFNENNGGADGTGHFPPPSPLVPGRPERLEASLPVREMMRAARQCGLQARASTDPGRYLCNFIAYRALEYAWTIGRPNLAAGFIHIPPFEVIAPDEWPPVLEAWIRILVKTSGGPKTAMV